MSSEAPQADETQELSTIIARYNEQRPAVLELRSQNRRRIAKIFIPLALIIGIAAVAAYMLAVPKAAFAIAAIGGIGLFIALIFQIMNSDGPADKLM